jgi:hypothetical protein
MTASLRIIKIVKDKNPISGEEEDDYTVEIEIESDDSSKLAIEIEKSPWGQEIDDMLTRAKFMVATSTEDMKIVEEKQLEEAERHEADIKAAAYKEGSNEMLEKLLDYLEEHGKPKTAEAIKDMLDAEEAKAEEEKEADEEKDDNEDNNDCVVSHP